MARKLKTTFVECLCIMCLEELLEEARCEKIELNRYLVGLKLENERLLMKLYEVNEESSYFYNLIVTEISEHTHRANVSYYEHKMEKLEIISEKIKSEQESIRCCVVVAEKAYLSTKVRIKTLKSLQTENSDRIC